jgi:O-acetyl-ADP-ribose deacetylase (regulator of RNase III)
LKARHIIHAVGPVWHGGGDNEDALLAGCYRTALDLAAQHRLISLAFPAISTGVYGFPADRAARIAVGTVAAAITTQARGMRQVIFCCFSESSAAYHQDAFEELGLV